MPGGGTAPAPPIEVTGEGQVLPETVVRGGDDPAERSAQEQKNVQTNKAEKMAYAADQARQNSAQGFLSGVGLPPVRRAVGAAEFAQDPNVEDVAQAGQVFKPGGGIDMNAIAARVLRLGSGEATVAEWGETASPAIMAAVTAGVARGLGGGRVRGGPPGEGPSPSNTLTVGEHMKIQGVSDRFRTAIDIVGSRGAGAGRDIETTLPAGKGPGTRSDIDLRIDSDVDIQHSGAVSDALKSIGPEGLVDVRTRHGTSRPPFT